MMKRLLILLAIAACVAQSCSNSSDKIKAGEVLSPSEMVAIKKSIIRYVAKAPDGVSGESRFDPKFNDYYEGKVKECFLELYAVRDSDHYFLVTQPAASLVEKRHATGGRFVLSDKGEITEYEEIFRTWKMKPEDLRVRSEVIFKDMIVGKSLERYYTKHAGDKYIEFPDDKVYYDKEARAWKTK